MKLITFDFLRGILVACIARDAAKLLIYLLPIGFPSSAVPSEYKAIWMLAIVLIFAVYGFVLSAVLFRPVSTTKMVFGILLAIALLWIGYAYQAFLGAHQKSHNISLISVLLNWSGAPITAAVAFLCHLRLKSNQVVSSETN